MKTIRYAVSCWGVSTACILVAMTAVPSPFLLSAQTSQSVSTEDLLVLLGGLEEATTVLEYDVQYSEHRGPSDAQVNFDEPLQKWEDVGDPTGVQKTAHFLLEYGTGRVNFTREGTGHAWVPHTNERFLSQNKRSLAFDGATRTQMHWNLDNTSEPGSGIISSQPLKPNKELSSFETGLDVILPFYRGVGLRRYLLSDKVDRSSICAELRSDGILEVSYIGTKKGQKFGLSIDLQKDGAILQETYYSTIRPDRVIVRTENTWEKDSQGNWIPRSSLSVQGSVEPIISRLSFEAVKRNHIEPTPEMFQIDFPVGTDVSDLRTGLAYVVGTPPTQLVEDVTATLAETHRMSDRPRSEEVNTPMPGRELSHEPAEANDAPAGLAEADRRDGPWVIIASAIVVGAFLSVWALRRQKIRKAGLGKTLVLLAVVLAWSWSGARADVATEKSFYGWSAPGPTDQQIPVYQCGLATTMYTLQYFDHPYRTEDLMNLMVPSAQGISLADIISAMQVHGLETSPRTGVRAKDLLTSLTDQRIAILPTAIGGERGHFYVIVRGKGSSFLLVDAGRSVKAQSVPEMQKRLRANGGIVTFVWVREQGEDARAVVIDPQEADLGKVRSNAPQVTSKFKIRNNSQRCILVTDVVPACSCTASGWKGGLLSPGQEVAIEISIKPAGLGIGQLKKSVVFRFADGSLQVAHIVGECLGPEESQGIRVAPTEVYFDFGEKPDSQTRQLKVFGKGPIHVAVNDADWISAKVIRQPATEPGIIDVVAEPNITGSDEDAGMLQVWVVDQEPRVAVPIHAVWPKPYRVECRIVTLAKDKEPMSGAFIFRKRANETGEIYIDPMACNLSGIQLQPVQNEQESRLQVNITDEGSLASGLHSIDLHIRVGEAARKPYSERVYVMVR